MSDDYSRRREEITRDLVPLLDGTYDVVAMPMETQGMLCTCHGKSPPPGSGVMSGGIRAVCRPPGGDPMTADEIFSNSSESVFPDSSNEYAWSLDQVVSAACATAPTGNNNTLYLAAWWFNMMSGTAVPPEVVEVDFRGKRAANCAKGSVAARTTPVTANSDFVTNNVEPWDLVGDAIEYRHLSVTNLSKGNCLLRRGVPLLASRIAVSAFDVAWQYGTGIPTLITKPLGEHEIAPDGWSFKGASRGAIVIWQGDVSRRRTVTTLDASEPDVLALDPTKPIYVHVNYHNMNMFNRQGAFGLRVRVID